MTVLIGPHSSNPSENDRQTKLTRISADGLTIASLLV